MAVMSEKVKSRMTLVFYLGADEDGEPIYKKKAYSRIKSDVTDENLFLTGQALTSIQDYVLDSVERADTNLIVAG